MHNIYSKHKHWINIVKNFGEKYYAEDIVQEAYIKVNGKDINEAYFYLTLRSLTTDLHRSKSKSIITNELDIIESDLSDVIDSSNYCIADLDMYMDKLTGYDKLLFKAFIKSGLSIRGFARETNISFMSVYSTIKKCKKILWQEKENHKDLETR